MRKAQGIAFDSAWLTVATGTDVFYEGISESGIPLRIWESLGGKDSDGYESVTEPAGTAPCLWPYDNLELLPLSPDFELLLEQRAALAEVLYFDSMTDEELMEFFRYVRPV